MLKVGITGSIGSGKTTVCRVFEEMGIPVYNADERAKNLMVTSPPLIQKIKDIFGNEAYDNEGRLNRKYISGIAFKNPEMLKKLNATVHPAVLQDAEDWFQSLTDIPYAIKEAALLVESGGYKMLDKLIVVTAPEEVRIQRVMKRDNVEREAVLDRMKNQLSEEEKAKHADFIIENDGKKSLVQQVWAIHRQLIKAGS